MHKLPFTYEKRILKEVWGCCLTKRTNEKEKGKKKTEGCKNRFLRTRTEIVPRQARWQKESKRASPSAIYLFFPHLPPTCTWNQEGFLEKREKRKKTGKEKL